MIQFSTLLAYISIKVQYQPSSNYVSIRASYVWFIYGIKHHCSKTIKNTRTLSCCQKVWIINSPPKKCAMSSLACQNETIRRVKTWTNALVFLWVKKNQTKTNAE